MELSRQLMKGLLENKNISQNYALNKA